MSTNDDDRTTLNALRYRPALYTLPLLAGAALLAAAPLLWLLRSWLDPLYNPAGLWIALLVAALFVWSLSSDRLDADPVGRRRALWLLLLTALVRLAGQLLGVNTIGALALAIDVYALALLAGLGCRRRPLAPFWLALLFAFALPLERVVQRIAGYGLQQLSASTACGVLEAVADDARCQGLRILWAGREVLVDLPCSGAGGLTLLLTFYCALACVYRPRPAAAVAGLALTLLAALFSNVVRILLLAVGYTFQESIGVDVMTSPWHDLLGLAALASGALPLLWAVPVLVRRFPATPPRRGLTPVVPGPAPARVRPAFGLGFLALAGLIVLLPARPFDVSRPLSADAATLPAVIAGLRAEPVELNALEKSYFTRYGGAAARAAYGPFVLLKVSTSAPLRHLHAPDECLTSAGYTVRYRGVRYDADGDVLPSSIYSAEAADGGRWRIAVSYVSDRGDRAANVAEAVWRWLQSPGSVWTMVQRAGPADMPIADLVDWDRAVGRALDLSGRADDFSRLALQESQP